MNEQEKVANRATLLWIVAAAVVCGGIGAVLGGMIGLVGFGAGTGLAVGAVVGFLVGMPSGAADESDGPRRSDETGAGSSEPSR